MSKNRKQTTPKTAGKKAAETRRKNVKHAKSQNAGKKAWIDSIRPGEKNYLKVLSKKLGIDKNRVFYHEGLPDLFVLTTEGKLRFFEIKPSKGGRERKLLNPRQVDSIRNLLKNELVEEVSIVRYEGKGSYITYEEPIRLTLSNLKNYSM